MGTPTARDIECLRAVRALVAASLAPAPENKPGDPLPLMHELIAEYGGATVVVFLAHLAEQTTWAIARDEGFEPWAILCSAVEDRINLCKPGTTWTQRNGGPLYEFAALAHACHPVSNDLKRTWADGLYERHGEWAVAAGVVVLGHLLACAGEAVEASGLEALSDLAMRQESALIA